MGRDARREEQLHYASLYDYHLRPYLGSIALREVTPEVIERW